MNEVDRLSNSGLYPVLPMGDKHPSRQKSSSNDAKRDRPPDGPPPAKADEPGADASGTHHSSKSLIDEYV
jgi:hypothetical protein